MLLSTLCAAQPNPLVQSREHAVQIPFALVVDLCVAARGNGGHTLRPKQPLPQWRVWATRGVMLAVPTLLLLVFVV